MLRAGAADPGLLISLPVLARSSQITIVRFAPRAPGASSGMPVLSVDLTTGPGPGALRAASVRELTAPSGLTFIRIDYAAPAPLNVSS